MAGLFLSRPAELSGQDSIGVEVPAVDSTAVDSVAYDSVLTYYPELYKSLLTRQGDSLWSWLNHEIPAVRQQAWRGLTHAKISDLYQLELEVEKADHPPAWMALSHHELNPDIRRILEQRWERGERSRSGISRVLGKQGDRQSLGFLLDHIDRIDGTDDAFSTALAIGRLTRRYGLSNSDQFKLIKTAFTAEEVSTGRAYLYGAYRSDSTIFSPEVQQNLYRLWQVYGVGTEPRLDQYLVKILGSTYPRIAMQPYLEVPVDSIDARLGIELASLAGRAPVDTINVRLTRKLLRHSNPHVIQTALRSAGKQSALMDSVSAVVKDSLLNRTSLPHPLWGEALRVAMGSRDGMTDPLRRHLTRLDSLRRENPYLLPVYLEIQRRQASQTRYFDKLDTLLQSARSLPSTFAARELADFWESQSDNDLSDKVVNQVQSLMLTALGSGDRGAVYAIAPLLKDDRLLRSGEYDVLQQTLKAFQLPADIEVYQAIGEVVYERFRKRGRPLIDSLVALDHQPLNRSLKETGWSVDSGEDTFTEADRRFRTADWQRLSELGPSPEWILRLRQDTIRIQLDPLRAPLTVSAIDSLTRAGAYDSVAFHRVVPNFVIQGGDIERGDGLGGPSYTLPTEPSELPYSRGSVGIASAGVDTEGSQYFIMHQWKPHLNGNYTRFGEVVEGMEAVERVMVGDRVLEAAIKKSEAGSQKPEGYSDP